MRYRIVCLAVIVAGCVLTLRCSMNKVAGATDMPNETASVSASIVDRTGMPANGAFVASERPVSTHAVWGIPPLVNEDCNGRTTPRRGASHAAANGARSSGFGWIFGARAQGRAVLAPARFDIKIP